MCVGQVVAGPQYVVVIPAVLESGEVSKVCATLLKPNESLSVTVTLTSEEDNVTLINVDTTVEINICNEFQVPTVEKEVVRNVEVEVKGNTFYSREIRKVMIRAYKPMSFIQTDKPIYLPGQTVNFRVVTLDTKFRPVDQLYELIELEDANGNRVGQWLNETSNGKILQLSYSLNSECVEGFYRITMHANGETKSQRFNVEKYVLPKFEVTVETKDEVSIGHDEFEAKVCAKYTFGQPVPGEAKLKVCRPLQRYYYHSPRNSAENDVELTPLCHEEIKQTDLTGCATFTLEMSTFTRIDQKILQDMLVFTVSVEEEGTGIALFQTKTAHISYVIGTLSFVDTPKIYEEGANVEGKVKAVHYNNTPIANMSLHLFVGEKWSARLTQNLTTNNDGIATFKVCTEDMEDNIRLEVSTSPMQKYARYRTPYYENGIHTLSLAKEASTEIKTSSSLEVKQKDKPLRCDHEEEIFIKYTVVGENEGPVDIMYFILSKGVILLQGRKQIDVQDGTATEGEVSLKFDVTANMAPFVQLIAYAILPSELVVAHSADFSTEKCFSHKVLLEFTPSSAVPGEETTMQVKADPASLCGVSAIDKSVLIKEPGKILDAEKIFNLLPVKKVDHIPYEVEDIQPCLHVRAKRYMPNDRDDPHTVFQSVGLKLATNLFVRVPTCLNFRGRTYHYGRGMIHPVAMEYDTAVSVQRMAASPGGFGGASPRDSPIIETVRTFFPETWIWDLVEVGDSGTKDVKVTVPDTITSWETEAFCLSEQGFGLAPRKEITVFQPFFLELTLPYSIIRGEHFELKATVFNYLSSCIKVSVIPTPSTDFTLIPLSGDGYVSCLCANERKTVSWSMAPSVLGVVDVSVSAQAMPSEISCNNEIVTVPERGRIDLVKKTIIVKAEGIEKTENFNWLFCPKDDSSEEEMEYKLPDNVIEGSARASVSVLGDIMGRALKNLDGLLRMPYGCGEQNIALLAPNIYILQYLKHTDQLTPAILEKSTKFLTSGYQRQLNYKLGSGAYSTFGTGSGNTWLTAFVLRSFVKAQSFIYIEPHLIKESKTWLETNQKKTGCFEKVGKLFNNRMKGGVSDEVTLSAYITAAFLEMNSSASDPVVNKSLTCLRESMSDLSNTYTTALMAYVFTLAGDMETRTRLLQHLDMVAVNKGGFLHWNQMSTETSASLSVEITSYVMLAVLSGSPTTEDLGYATRIVRWLTTQQNYYGGFSSTQDTVVALQALALYSTLVFSPEGSSTLTVDSPGQQMTFDVNQNNKLLYQEKELKDVEGKYRLQAKGSACASVQLSVHYNIPTPAEVTTLSVEVSTEANCTSIVNRPRLILKLKSLYSGKENSSNMVILNIKMLSGFVPDQQSLAALKVLTSANRVDVEDDHILIYIQQLQSGLKLEQNLELIQELPVQNLKPAVVQIYDYYDPSVKAETEYIYKCVAG